MMHDRWIDDNINWGVSEHMKSKMATKRPTVTIQADIAGVQFFCFTNCLCVTHTPIIMLSHTVDIIVQHNLISKMDAKEITSLKPQLNYLFIVENALFRNIQWYSQVHGICLGFLTTEYVISSPPHYHSIVVLEEFDHFGKHCPLGRSNIWCMPGYCSCSHTDVTHMAAQCYRNTWWASVVQTVLGEYCMGPA